MTELERLAIKYQEKEKTMRRLGNVISGSKRLQNEESHNAYLKAFDAWQQAESELKKCALNFKPE